MAVRVYLVVIESPAALHLSAARPPGARAKGQIETFAVEDFAALPGERIQALVRQMAGEVAR